MPKKKLFKKEEVFVLTHGLRGCSASLAGSAALVLDWGWRVSHAEGKLFTSWWQEAKQEEKRPGQDTPLKDTLQWPTSFNQVLPSTVLPPVSPLFRYLICQWSRVFISLHPITSQKTPPSTACIGDYPSIHEPSRGGTSYPNHNTYTCICKYICLWDIHKHIQNHINVHACKI
jgi:hypothetical protein